MNWREVVKLLCDVFGCPDFNVVVNSLESHGVHAVSSEGGAVFYAEDEMERYSEEFYLEGIDLEMDPTKDSKVYQHPCYEQFPILRNKKLNHQFIQHYLQYQPKALVD